MSSYSDDNLVARFAAMAPEPMHGDWLDVQRRFQARKKRRLVAYGLAAALALLLVGCTAAFGTRVVDFFEAESSPPHVIDFLSVVQTANSYADPSFPGFDPKQTRRVIDEPFAGGTIQLDLTPLRGEGFCLTVRRSSTTTDGDSTDCATPERTKKEVLVLQETDGRTGTGGGVLGKHEGGVVSFIGWVTAPGVQRLELRYEDGRTAAVPFFRVTAPIDADFFLFDVPDANARYPHRVVELAAFDGNGTRLAKNRIVYEDPDEWTFPRYGDHGFPPAANAKAVRVLRFPGVSATIKVAPAKGGVTCFIFHLNASGSDACPRDPPTRQMFRLDENSFFPGPGSGQDHPVLLWGLVESRVRRIELVYQDGARDVTRPQEQFALYEVPVDHYLPGTRLLGATLRAADGRVVRRVSFDPTMRDLYPCENPREIGFGPPVCP
jgi:hypothetical protein